MVGGGETPSVVPGARADRTRRARADACVGLFDRLRCWFNVGPELRADLTTISSPVITAELHQPQLVMAFAMRRLQALYHLAQPGVRTTVDVVVHSIDAVLPRPDRSAGASSHSGLNRHRLG